MPKKRRFFREDVRFECQGCGQCCVTDGDYQDVYLTPEDLRRLAAYFKTTVSKFKKQYVGKCEDEYYLKSMETKCLFMKRRKCTVYEARPLQCRTWPFWPENMTPKVWEKEVAVRCPGVGKGKTYTAKDIESIMEQFKDVGGYDEK